MGLKRETIVFLIFTILGSVLMSLLWSLESWPQFWGDLGYLKGMGVLALVNFVFGFVLVYTAKQTRTGYALVAPFVASFFLVPYQIWLIPMALPFPTYTVIYGGTTHVAAVLGGFTARRFFLKRMSQK